ncbi:sialate O-acetylesterase [Aestuariimicrobium sp. T2.26MG-19.2B]|uniref:sialate O-acetylesterase n=1 Tax=Aestuariimicrobium sp. T2.26MG-19.2B TaxID=3040679 RepID=UPI002477921B|nr:sialate O-acetylesterase [Aestuariimicrobium sp. T2.26MG-19.2B]CAI9402097.1 hypothetical protein AESSP_00730 [Aestuariimicrobium sp. T2.26MG-19.2B]
MPRRHRPLPVPAWVLVSLVTALALAVAAAGVLAQRLARDRAPEPRPVVSTGADGLPSTSCDKQARAEGLVPMRVLDVPERASWTSTPPVWSYDRVPEGFVPDRVGYCLELGGPSSSGGPQAGEGTTKGSSQAPRWAFASMLPTGKASDLAMPVRVGEITRQSARDLTVSSNDPAVTAVQHGQGWLEMWPNSYVATASRQVPGPYTGDDYPSDHSYDSDDTPSGGEYGSFQVHEVDTTARTPGAGASRTVLALNGWAGRGGIDVGIGTAPAPGSPDWTFSQDAGQYSMRRLTFFARQATAVVENGPRPMQLLARAPGATQVATTISGGVTDPRATVALVTSRAGRSSTQQLKLSQGRFTVRVRVPVALVGTTFEVRSTLDGVTRLAWRAEDVLAGDALLVQGQSNAVAAQVQGSAHAVESEFVRSFGSQTPLTSVSLADDQWNRGIADTLGNAGSIGQWAAELGHRIVTQQRVPVAIINGGEGGRPVAFFQRSPDGAADPDTNYGRTILRLRGAGVQSSLSAVLWYQGEGDHDQADVYAAGFTQLVSDWRDDLDGPRIYQHQVRVSPCDSATAINLRERQRELGPQLDVGLLTTQGLTAQIGCHFAFENGYRTLGDWNHRVLAADLYGGSRRGVLAPDVTGAQLDPSDPRVVWLSLRATDPLTVEPGVERDFRVNGAAPTSVAFESGRLRLTSATAVPTGTEVRYLGHVGAGAFVRTGDGAGMLAFAGVRVRG